MPPRKFRPDYERKVTNVSVQDVSYLEDKLSDIEDFTGVLQPGIFVDPSILAVTIVSFNEIRNMQRHLQITPDESHWDALDEHIRGSLPAEAWEPLIVDTLPALYVSNHRNRRAGALIVGHSLEAEHERQTGQRAVESFYKLKKSPNGVWFNRLKGGAQIASARDYATQFLLKNMAQIINCEPTLLPGKLHLNPVTPEN